MGRIFATAICAACCVSIAIQSQAAAQKPWWHRSAVYRTKYYELKTDLPADQARQLGRHMDATCESYVATFSKLPVRVRRPAMLQLLLFAEQGDYLQTLATRFRTDGQGSWGKCITRGKTITLVAYRGDHTIEEMKPLLQHEGFHQFASHLFPDIPPWANEGLAEVFERGVALNDHLVLGEFPARDQQRLVEAMAGKHALGLKRLLAMPAARWSRDVQAGDAATNYLQAWSFVHFMLYADQNQYRRSFLSFLVQLNAETNWEQAFFSSFQGWNLASLEQRWSRHITHQLPTDIRECVRRLDFLAAGMLHLREKEIYPASFSELKTELMAASFLHSSAHYRQQRQLSAEESEVFELPGGGPGEGYRLVDKKGRPPRKNYASRRNPAPLHIVTRSETAPALQAVWSKRGTDYRYAILPSR